VCRLAEECGISAPHLRRLFRATMGTSVSTYVEGIRLERAKAMLADRTLPLKGIAHRLGFANASAFSAAFRREAGTSPNKYRQQIIA
jgi:AraC family transcriptional regulator